MTLEETIVIINTAVKESVMDGDQLNLVTSGDDILKDIGLDSLDWSIVLMHIEDEVLLSEEVIGDLGELIGKGCTVQDALDFFVKHGL